MGNNAVVWMFRGQRSFLVFVPKTFLTEGLNRTTKWFQQSRELRQCNGGTA
jgi:hypothetical protein